MSENSPRNQSPGGLVNFASPIFDLILRIKSGILTPSAELRPKAAALLKDFESRATRYRFDPRVIQVAKFGLAAFTDETILTNNFPLKDEWEKNPLQLEYFGEQLAGNKFFDKLQAMLKQIETTKDAVEIYYFCMLLGFKGRYAVYEQEKLREIMQATARALMKSGRMENAELSPHWMANDQPKPIEKRGMPAWAKVAAFGGLGFAVIIYLVMFIFSSKFLQDAIERLGI